MPLESPGTAERAATDNAESGLWQVVLIDDDQHTYDYVIEMLMEVCGHPMELAFQMACDVDVHKRVVVDVTSKEAASEKCRRISSFGPDWRMKRSRRSMQSVMEPLD